ncbi:MAG: MBG domain-containing protein [Candidatus Methanoperedens sp.]|nr:MBG domain-containing protein [Candidatus Methanoperedens sp.]
MSGNNIWQLHAIKIAAAILIIISVAGNASAEIISVDLFFKDNTISLINNAEIKIGILSQSDFYAPDKVDVSTVRFAGVSADTSAEAKKPENVRDLDNDGIKDLLLHFKIAGSGIQCGDSQFVILTGNTKDGDHIVGTHSINIEDCSLSPAPPYIYSFAPLTQRVMNNVGDSRAFNISVNQTVTVIWFIDGTPVQVNGTGNEPQVTESKYGNISAQLGTWNVSVYAQNFNGRDAHFWDWIVGKIDQNIIFDGLPDKTYGDSAFTVSATASSGLPVSFTASGQCTVSGNIVTLTGAGSCTITASQPGKDNYNAAPSVDQTFNIAKAAATITLSDLAQTYDGSPKSATVTTSPAGLSEVSITYDGSATAPTSAGSYAVQATLTNANYQAVPATGTFVINKADQISLSVVTSSVSGGCGRNVYTNEQYSNVKQHEYSREIDVHMSKTTIVFLFNTLGIVTEAGFTPKTNEGCTSALGENLKGRPSKSTSDASLNAIYFNIWVGPPGYSESSRIEDQYLMFKASDVTEDESVKLMIYKNDAWIDLKTEKISEDTYKAYTQGFGSFAIVRTKVPASTITLSDTTLPASGKSEEQKPVNLILIIFGMFLVIGITVIYYLVIAQK